MSKEIVILPPTVTEVENLPLIADLQFLEVATSEALNRKLKGVIDAGVYQGFTYKLGSGLKLIIGDDSGKNTACVERESVLMTVQGQHAVTLNIPAGKQSSIVIEAFYQYGVTTKQVDINSDVDAAKLLVVDSNKVLDHHVVLYDVTVPSDATQITDAMISTDRRTLPNWTIEEINGLREELDYKVSKTSRDNNGAIVVTTGTEEEKPATADLDDALLRFTKGLGFEGYNPELKEWGAIGGAGTPTFIVTTENTTLRANKGYLFNVASKSLTATLPANPKVGDWVAVGDYNGSCSHLKTIKIVTSDDSTIHGHTNLIITDANAVITLSFVDETNQWKVVDGVGENSNGGVISKELEEVRAMLGSLVGQEMVLPPTIADVNPSLIPKAGGLYSRAAYPLLWNWLEQHPEILISEADWQKHVSASPIAATPYYSMGNGVDNFRVPTVGLGGFSRAVGTESRPDIATGHQDQLQNIKGSFFNLHTGANGGQFASSIHGADGAFFSHTDPATLGVLANSGSGWAKSVDFDASRVARTGNETQPKAFYNKVYIYTGNNALGIPKPYPQWMNQQQTNTDELSRIKGSFESLLAEFEEIKNNKFDSSSLFPIGHVLITTNAANPSTYGYAGTWSLLDADVSLVSTRESGDVDKVSGTNAPAVPLPVHNHSGSVGGTTLNSRFNTNATGNHAHSGSTNTTGNHGHSGSTNTTGNHAHNIKVGWHTDGAPSYVAKSERSHTTNHSTDAAGNHSHSLSINAAGNHSHSISTNTTGNHSHYTDVNFGSHGHGLSINNNGVSNPTIDVRGRHLKVYMYKRTA